MRARRIGMLLCLLLAVGAAPASATDGPWIATLGDSYISGENGRWAGNTISGSDRIDALGPTAYWDGASGETQPGCHRSKSAEVFVGGGVQGVNLACSGAETRTDPSETPFKPGVDRYDGGGDKVGQALALQRFASTHDVRMVAVSIGGNDFGFADVVERCVIDYLTSGQAAPNVCQDDKLATDAFSPVNRWTVMRRIRDSLRAVRTAMRDAGYADDRWTLLVQGYESPIAPGAGNRYPEADKGARVVTGGCGVWDADADWATRTALAAINGAVATAARTSGIANLVQLDLSRALNGRRLCERGVDRIEKTVGRWDAPGAVDVSEWVGRVHVFDRPDGTYQVQESVHPNYWGQLALRSCLRQAYNGGAPRGGSCVRAGNGLTSAGEPVMALR